ncbi:hypothetical protein C6P42_004308 [Pichia californica]|nr:hypothetical protein C6P42_004308 [[Candida] californica]
MKSVDYYSEDISACDSEPEILEFVPTFSIPETIEDHENNENSDPCLIIENDNSEKMKILNSDFESKIKNQLLFNFPNKQHGVGKKISIESKNNDRLLKFTLLENQLRALMIEIENDDESINLNLKNKVDSLVNDIENFKLRNENTFINYWNEKLNTVCDKKNDDNKNENESENENNITIATSASTSPESQFLQFESRVSKLENRLGYDSSNDSKPTVQKVIDDLYLKVNLILDNNNNNNFKPIEDELLKMIENCETYIKDSKRIRDKSEIIPFTDKKLNLLYEKIKNLPDFQSLLEKIMSRFRSLNSLILETSTTIQFMKGLQTELFNIENHLDDWDGKLVKLESDLADDKKRFDTLINS